VTIKKLKQFLSKSVQNKQLGSVSVLGIASVQQIFLAKVPPIVFWSLNPLTHVIKLSQSSHTMARSIEPLIVGKVIGDVLDMFTPAANFTVHYGSRQIANGCEIKPSLAVDRPNVQILGPRVSTNLYSLVRKFIDIYLLKICMFYI
jgi:hypothetical protein